MSFLLVCTVHTKAKQQLQPQYAIVHNHKDFKVPELLYKKNLVKTLTSTTIVTPYLNYTE